MEEDKILASVAQIEIQIYDKLFSFTVQSSYQQFMQYQIEEEKQQQ